MSSFFGFIIIIFIISVKVLTNCPMYSVKKPKFDAFFSIFGIKFRFIQ